MIGFHVIQSRQVLRNQSDFIQQGIESIHAKGMSQSVCFGDVYMGIASGALNCTLMLVDELVTGFFITEIHTEHNGEQSLCLAYVYIAPTSVNLTPRVVQAFNQQAKQSGCSKIRFKTVREGWLRRLQPYGFRQSAIELTQTVQ